MIEKTHELDWLAHATALLGIAVVAFPLWLTFVASTHAPETFFSGVVPFWPGGHLVENYIRC